MDRAPLFILLLVIAGLSFYAGTMLFSSPVPGPFTVTDTVYVAQKVPAFDAPPPAPDTRTLFEEIEVPRDTCLGVPTPLRGVPISLVAPRPVTFDRDRVILTRFDTQAGRYVQDAYRTRRPVYTIAPYIEYDRTGAWQQASAGALFRWRDFTFAAGPAVIDSPVRGAVPALSFGVRYLPFRYHFGYE